MKIKNTAIGLATVILVLVSGLPLTAAADKVVNMDMRFAGAFAIGVMRGDPTTGAPKTSALIHANAVGSPGRAEIRGFGGTDAFGGFDPVCLGSPGLKIDVLENPLVFTFRDLSLLFANSVRGTICIDPMSGDNRFEIDIEFMGGRGRFEGATGLATITGEAEPVSSDGSFLGETGTIVGWIHVPGG